MHFFIFILAINLSYLCIEKGERDMMKSRTRILGALILLVAFLLALPFWMSNPKAVATEEFPAANLENAIDNNVAYANDSAVYTNQNADVNTGRVETKNLVVDKDVAAACDTTCKHNWEHIRKIPTCANEGYEKDTCTLCGEEQVTVLPRCEHVEGEWIITVHPTEYADGVRLKDCIYCDIILYFENFR
jgi:hypothetical protein